MEKKGRWEVTSGITADKLDQVGRFDEAQKAFDVFMNEAATKVAKLVDFDQAQSVVGQAFQLVADKVRQVPAFTDPQFQQMFDKTRALDEQHVEKAKGMVEELLGKGAIASLQMATPLGAYTGPLVGQTDRFIAQQLADKPGAFVLHEKQLVASMAKDLAQGQNVQVEYVKGLALAVGAGADQHQRGNHQQHLRHERQHKEKDQERDLSR